MVESLGGSGREVLQRVETPRGDLQLQRRARPGGGADGDSGEAGPIFEIIENGVFLMSSEAADSERALAVQTLEGIDEGASVLVAGLGLGITLREVLASDRVAAVQVVELQPVVVEWNRGPLAELNGDALADRRVRVACVDLGDYLARCDQRFGAITLDVDNGPSFLTLDENAALYRQPALERLRALLVDGGVLTIWSAQPEPELDRALTATFGNCRVVEVAYERGERRVVDLIYRAQWRR